VLLWLIRGAGGGEIRGAEGFGGGGAGVPHKRDVARTEM